MRGGLTELFINLTMSTGIATPKTQNERRQNQAAVDDGFHVRGKRRRPNLPHSWDDLRYSWHSGKCCKRFTRRKHQYK